MSGFILSFPSFFRMIDMCTSRCNGASLEENDQLGLNNCMDRCIYKYERTRKIVEQVLEQQGNTQPSFVSFKPTVLFNTQCISSKGRKNKRRFMNRLRVVTELRNHVFWNRMIHLAHIILTLLYRKNEPDLTTWIRRNRCVRVTN